MNRTNRQRVALVFVVLTVGLFRLFVAEVGFDSMMAEWLRPITSPIARIAESYQPQAEDAQLQATQQEIQRLKERLNLENTDKNATTTEVIRRDLEGQRQIVWVRNPDAKLEPGSILLHDGFLFGRVTSAADSTAQVQLVTDPLFRITGQVNDRHGIVRMQHGSLRFQLVPNSIKEGQIITSDSIDRIFPVGIPIGLVGESAASSGDVYKSYYVRIPYNAYNVRYVEVAE